MNYFKRLNDDVITYFLQYLPRTDKVALKLTNITFYNLLVLNNLSSKESIYEELCLYLRSIDDMDYSWKNSQHMLIRTDPLKIACWDLRRRWVETNHLWWFFVSVSYEKIFPGDYIFLFDTSVLKYNLKFIIEDIKTGDKSETSFERKCCSNFEEFEFKVTSVSNITIQCFEPHSYKHRLILRYILFLPKYYWKQLNQYFPFTNA
jgi:hypothetical protein